MILRVVRARLDFLKKNVLTKKNNDVLSFNKLIFNFF